MKEFKGQVAVKGPACPSLFFCRVIKRPKYGGGLNFYRLESVDSDFWIGQRKQVEAVFGQYIIVTPYAEAEALLWCGAYTRGIITEVESYCSHLVNVKRGEVAKEAFSHQIVIVGAVGIYRQLRNGQEIRVDVSEGGGARIAKI